MKVQTSTISGLCVATLGLVVFCVGCDGGPKSARGFRLPDGDAAEGKATFLALGCSSCHTVSGVETPTPTEKPEVMVRLGGEVSRIKTYGHLVTSIINPSHTLDRRYPKEKVAVDGVSRMTNFNDAMTVSQLTNLVAFLQAQYKIKRDDTLYYPYM